ncbi:MAG: T9SS type A sorting domain-containing protein, partial [Bacteroidetes bacterium]|nr:T9SS type A sorting domain-containing protein [Bacteroidota bacterium]
SLVGEPLPTEATLRWYSIASATDYELSYKSFTLGGPTLKKYTGLDTVTTIMGLIPNESYMASVRSKCNGAWKQISNIVYFTTPNITGVNPTTNDLISLGIYPNPTTGNVKIISSKSIENQVFRIVDIMGKIVMEKTINLEKDSPTELDFNQLSQGTYFIYTDFEGNKIANKLMVIR